MMLYPAMKDLLRQIPNRYLLVNVVAHRAREIARDADAARIPLTEKPVSMAIEEAAEGKLTQQADEAPAEE